MTTEKTTETTETTVEAPAPVLAPDGPSTRIDLPERETIETTTTETTETPRRSQIRSRLLRNRLSSRRPMPLSRADIAASIAGVPGVTPSADRPPSLGAGVAWPVLRSETTTHGGCALEVRWYVLVVGPNADEGSTIAAADPMVLPLVAALRGIGLVVETVEPVRLPVENGQAGVPALRVSAIDHAWIG